VLLHYLAKRGNTKITYFTQLDCVTHTMHLCALFLKENKNSSGDEIANVNFFYNIAHVEASAYAH